MVRDTQGVSTLKSSFGRCFRILLAAALLGPPAALPFSPAASGAASDQSASPKTTDGQNLRWPLDRTPAIVSGFGEYRYDHMHAGIDISTGGANGLKVRAAAGGTIVRLKVEWRGYGRALYLRHPGGRTTVYAHLDRFEDDTLGLERLVRRRQAASGTRYPGDIYLDPAIPVRRGQVIAFSGESGAGPPHLHFEIRGTGDRPLDPFRAGLQTPQDRQPPVLESLIITAAEPGTYIDGVHRERSYSFARRGALHLMPEPVRVSGAFHATLAAHDAVPGGRVGLRLVEVRVDDRLFYRIDLDAFRFDQYPLSGLIYDHRFSHLGPTRFGYRLAPMPGNALASGIPPGERSGSAVGSLDLEEGVHRLDLVVRDAVGVESRARACVLVGRPGPLTGARPLADGGAAPSGAIARFDPIGVPEANPARRFAEATLTGDGDACVMPPDAVEGGLWSEKDGRFRPLDCDESRGLCFAGPMDAKGPLSALRLRQVKGGVPGPWQIFPEPMPAAPDAPLRADLFSSFIDLRVPVRTGAPPPAPADRSCPAPGGSAWRLREDGTIGSGTGYAQAASLPETENPEGLDCLLRRGLAGVVLRHVGPSEAARLDGAGFRLEVPVGARFYEGPLAARSEPAADLPPGLRAISAAVDVLPEGEALNARAVLFFDLGATAGDTKGVGIFRFDPVTGRWSFEGDSVEADARAISLPFRRHGRFALLRDESSPVVTALRPRPEARVAGPRVEILAEVEEIGKGLGPDGVSFLLDGVPLESEFDPDRGTARPVEVPRLKPGRHHLRVVATDRAGNVSAPVEARFEVR